MSNDTLIRREPIAALLILVLAAWGASPGTALGAAPDPDVAAVVKDFQLVESARPARELVPHWRRPKEILVLVDAPERTAWLQEAMPPGVKVVGVLSERAAAPYLAAADALVMFPCVPALVEKAPHLQWLHMGSAGSDQCLTIPRIASGEALMTNSQKEKDTGLAEMAMGYVFALARSIDVGLENQRLHDFNAIRGRPAKQLRGSTMLIVGLGGAGTEIARIAHALGMRVIATRNSSREGPPFVSYVGLADETPKLVGQADVVVVCAPLTPATRGLFDAAMFKRMKRNAMFIDWTRVEITVPQDLAAALKAGTIGSAALNWATSAPLTKTDPLWSAPNLILAPWGGTGGGRIVDGRIVSRGTRAAESSERKASMDTRWVAIRENMRRFAAGEKMYSVFDLKRGY